MDADNQNRIHIFLLLEALNSYFIGNLLQITIILCRFAIGIILPCHKSEENY